MSKKRNLTEAEIAELDANHARREAIVRRACEVMGWEYSMSPAWTGLRKVAKAEAVAVGVDKLSSIIHEIEKLRDAIKTHRDQKADDRCIEDDDRLYAVLADGVLCDRRVGDKAEMLVNCARFIERRCEGGGWPTYAELEKQLAESRAEVARLRAKLPPSCSTCNDDGVVSRRRRDGSGDEENVPCPDCGNKLAP